MDTNEKLHLITVILLVTTGVLHIIQPLIFGVTVDAIGAAVFGVIYLSLGILLQVQPENKIIALLSFLLPAFGMCIAIGILALNFTPWLLFLVLFDVVIIPTRIYLYKENF